MSVTLRGSRGASWTAATWVARSAAPYIIAALQSEGQPQLATIVSAALAGDVDAAAGLGELLDDDRMGGAFARAAIAAAEMLQEDGAADWRDPGLFGAFAARFRELAVLGRADGNVLVLELAARPLEDRSGRVIGVAEALKRHSQGAPINRSTA